jgi:translocation protein SEC72
MGDTFTQLPLSFNDKTLTSSYRDSAVQATLDEVNRMHNLLLQAPQNVPPPPVPVPPQRSAAIEKMRTTGNAAFRKGNYKEAINMYSHAITMALTRPPWEPSGLAKEELQVLYANRAQAFMSLNCWPEALADASVAVDFKKVQNPKAHWRKGKALKEMGRLEEAKQALELGLEFGQDADLKSLLKEVDALLEEKKVKESSA